MTEPLLKQLQTEGLLKEETLENIRSYEANKAFSLHWELKSLLYLGVILLNIGLGILIYQHINTFGHAILVALIALLSIACFAYCFRYARGFSWGRLESPTPYFDYVLMLGCFTFLIFEGYLQQQYNVFGTRYGLATAIPTVLFFATAYYFDHRGALSLALTALTTWAGISVTPQTLLEQNDFDSPSLIRTATLLGVALTAGALLLGRFHKKRHFTDTYLHFSVHLYLMGALCGLFFMEQPLLWIALLALGIAFFIWYARIADSYVFQLFALLYAYVGMTYCMFKFLLTDPDATVIFLYFILSGIGLIVFLLRQKRANA